MNPLTQITTARDSLLAALVTVCASPKPNYNLDGQSVSWGEYFKMLSEGVKELTELMGYFDPVIVQSNII